MTTSHVHGLPGPLPGPAPAGAYLVGWFRPYVDGKLALQRVSITSEWPVTQIGNGTTTALFASTSGPDFDTAWRRMLGQVFTYPSMAWARPWLRADATRAAQTRR